MTGRRRDLFGRYAKEDKAVHPDIVLKLIDSAILSIRATKDSGNKLTAFLPHQIPPDGDWFKWCLVGGRGSGKTWAGSQFIMDHLRKEGRKARVHVVAPTISDCREICFEGESGLHTLFRHEFDYKKSKLKLYHVGGGIVRGFGAEEPDRLRGPQCSRLWGDEASLWPEESFKNADLGLRLGDKPRALFTFTPRRRAFIKELLARPTTVRTHGTTFENIFLSESIRNYYDSTYKGTFLYDQELNGKFVDSDPNAYWEYDWIDKNRIRREELPLLVRTVVAVDPATKKKKANAETGIAVVGLSETNDAFVLHSEGLRVKPSVWAEKVLDAFYKYNADEIIAEDNQGGEMVSETILNCYQSNFEGKRRPKVEAITATVSKQERALPVSILYKNKRVHHVGYFPDLEDQLSTFPTSNEFSDRLDSLVYGVAKLILKSAVVTLSAQIAEEQRKEKMKWASSQTSSKVDQRMK